MAKGCYRLGPFWWPKRSKETMVMQASCCTECGSRDSAGHISESLASGARRFQGPSCNRVPHKDIPMQKEKGSKHPGTPPLMAVFS